MPTRVPVRLNPVLPPADVSRRGLLARSAAMFAGSALAAVTLPVSMTSAAGPAAAEPFRYCLNTSTIRGANLGLDAAIDIAAKAGFNAIEPWISELEAFEKKGGSLKDLGKKLKDAGLAVPSSIGFAKWILNDETERNKGVEQMKRDMEKVLAIGGTHIAAPPVGATKPEDPDIDPRAIVDRYDRICEVGLTVGVAPELEVWGFSKTLTTLSDAAMVTVACGRANACILADVYHLYKGGSNPNGLRLLSGSSMHVMHFNDYPADPPREKINDAERIFPGDGVAPITQILQTLRDNGFAGYLSLELFNRTYWKENPAKVADAGIAKMKAAVAKAMAT